MVIAYLRVTKDKKHLEKQKLEIDTYVTAHDIKIDKWVTDVVDIKRKDNTLILFQLITRMKKGDKLIITDIARLGRTLSEVMKILNKCMEKGIGIYSLNDRYILDDYLDMQVIGKTCILIADIEHHLMSTRTKEALAHKKDKKGVKLGRPKGTAAKQAVLKSHKEEVMNMLERGDTVEMICNHFNVSRNTYYQFKRNYGL